MNLTRAAINAGIVETLTDLRGRLGKADQELAHIRRNPEPLSVQRIDGKIAGVRLALSRQGDPAVTDPDQRPSAAPQIRSIDTPDGVRHYDDTGREYRATEVDGELSYLPAEETP